MPFYYDPTRKEAVDVSDPAINKSLVAGMTPIPFVSTLAEAKVVAQDPGRYGIVTPAEGGGTLVDRYASQKQVMADSGAFDTISKPDEEKIREAARQRAQARINAINDKFASIEAQDREMADLMNREQRAANVLNGLTASDAGRARTISTMGKGEALIKNTAAQKESEIAAVLSDAEARGTDEFQKQRTDWIAQQKDKYAAEQSLNAKVKDDALMGFGTLAAGRTSLDELTAKNPNYLKQMMKDTGMDDQTLRAYYLTKIPKADLLSDSGTKLSDGSVAYYQKQYDAQGNVTGLKEVLRIDGGQKPIETTSISPDGVFILYKDGTTAFKEAKTGKEPDKSKLGYSFSNEDKGKLAAAGFKESEIKFMEGDIRQYGATKVLDGLTDTQQKEIVSAILSGSNTKQFLTKDFLRGLYSNEQLKTEAVKAGFTKGGFLGMGVGEQGVSDYLDSLVKVVDQYRAAGFSDDEILKMMK